MRLLVDCISLVKVFVEIASFHDNGLKCLFNIVYGGYENEVTNECNLNFLEYEKSVLLLIIIMIIVIVTGTLCLFFFHDPFLTLTCHNVRRYCNPRHPHPPHYYHPYTLNRSLPA